MDLIKFVPEQLLILVPALFMIGFWIKNTNIIEDCYIPFILMAISIIFSIFIMGFTSVAILQGIICTGVAVLVENVAKQGTEIADKFQK